MRKQRSLFLKLLGFSFVISLFLLCNFNSANAAQRWVETYSTSTTRLYAVWATSVSTVHAVGSTNIILQSTDEGYSFTSSSPLANVTWYDVCFPTDLVGYVFGGAATGRVIYKTIDGGLSWSSSYSAAGESLYAGYFKDANTGWAVGSSGNGIYTTDGSSWLDSVGLADNLWGVQYASDANTGWAVGDGGDIYDSTNGGANYSSTFIAGAFDGYDIHIFNTSSVVVVGTDVYKLVGGSWEQKTVTGGTGITWMGVDFVNNATGWMVGRSGPATGDIFKSTDGGGSWVVDSAASGVSFVPLKNIFMYDEYNGWAVGHPNSGASKVYKLVTDPIVSPASSYTTSDTAQNVVINGENFHPTVNVTTSASALSIISVTHDSSTQITVNVTAPTAGTYPIIVSNPLDTGATASSLIFNAAASTAPIIDGVLPISGVEESIVSLTITGSNFDPSGTTKVNLQNTATIPATSVNVASSSQITCRFDLSGGDTGLRDVVVINPDGQSAIKVDAFTITTRGAGDINISALSFDGDDYDFTTRSASNRYVLSTDSPTIVADYTATSVKSDPNFAILVDKDCDGIYEKTVDGSEIEGITYLADTSSSPNTMKVTFILPSLITLGMSSHSDFNLVFYAEDLNDVATRPVIYLGWSSTHDPATGGPIADICGGPSPCWADRDDKMYFNIESNVAGPTKFRIWGSSGLGPAMVRPINLVVGRNTVEWDVRNISGDKVASGLYIAWVDRDRLKRFKFVVIR